MTGIHVRERDGEVNEVEIEVIKTPVIELFLRQCLDLHLGTPFSWCDLGSVEESHMIMGMECVPQLKINLTQIGVLNQECLNVSTLEVMTIRARAIDQ